MRNAGHPPFWTWPAAFLLAALLILAAWAAGRRGEGNYDSAYFNLSRLDSGRTLLPTIALVGDSRTRCAIEYDDRMERRLAALGTPAQIVRLTKSWATVGDLRNVFARLQSARPSAVMIESNLITLEPNPFRLQGMRQIADWRERTRHGLTGLLPRQITSGQSPENEGVSWLGCGLAITSESLARRRETMARLRASTAEERAPFVEVAGQLRSRGVRVFLLDLPERTDSIGRKPAALVRAQQAAMQQLLATKQFERISDPPRLGPEFFNDEGHLSRQGQARTSAWLASKLSDMLRQNGPS